MKNNLRCELVKDLMPSYIDGLTSDVTNTAVREHISHCDNCKATLESMKEPYNEEKIRNEKKEIDFLKKTRKRNIKVVLSSLISVVLIVSIIVASLPYFVRYSLDDSMFFCNLTVEGDKFNIKASADHKNAVITDIIYDVSDSGVLDISFEGREKTSFDGKKLFSWSYTSDKVNTVTCQGKVLWEDGEYISAVTSAAYKYRTPYIGDMSHNSVLAGELGIREHLGSFTNKLTTVKEPYGWELIFSDPFIAEQLTEKENLMESYAYVLLGLIGNLGEVTFTYEVITPDGEEEEHTFTVTQQQATEFFGEDIKKCAYDINTSQSLMEKTGLATMPYIDAEDTDSFEAEINEMISFKLFNASDSEISKITLYCKETETYVEFGSRDDELFNIGKRHIITTLGQCVPLELLSGNAYDERRLGNITLEVKIYDRDDNVYATEKNIEVSAFSGAVYSYTLVGNFENGFELRQ